MRVISGSAKGLQLRAVPGSGTRPVSDRVKEALFNILGAAIQDASMLDLYAGTGSVGIEALSRGAKDVVFVEKNPRAVSTIRANLRATSLGARARILKTDVFRALGADPEPFDFVYVAPPQYVGLWKRTLCAIDSEPRWLSADGEVIVQIFPKELEPVSLAHLTLFDQRKYGSTLLCFYGLQS